jgi:1D-myo-inositol-tetrakisphosphate 5-kinase/inositol-polyphosphate multikinase
MASFEHQVAGHAGNILESENGTLLKLVTHVEHQFYQEAQGTPLVTAMPKYFGSRKMTVDNEEQEYIEMENLLAGCINPSIMDVKLGKILYGRDATPEKRLRMEEQAVETTSGATGLRICGMKLWNGNSYESFDRKYGRSLNPSTLQQGFNKYFEHCTDTLSIVDAMVLKIDEMVSALKNVNCSFGGVSLLMVYSKDKVVVRLMDFAHSHFVQDHDNDVELALQELKKRLIAVKSNAN